MKLPYYFTRYYGLTAVSLILLNGFYCKGITTMNKNLSPQTTARLDIQPISYQAGSPAPPKNIRLKRITIQVNTLSPEAQEGHMMMNRNDCYSCHGDFTTLAAPSYIDIAKKYENDPGAIIRLATHIIKGSRGIWEDREMKSHPELLQEDAQKMVKYILTLAEKADMKN